MLDIEDDRMKAEATGPAEIAAASAIAIAHIKSRVAMKLGLYVLSAVFVITASLLIVFAPSGRETPTAIVAAALFALAIGSAGLGAFWIKTPLVSAGAGRGTGGASLSATTGDLPVPLPEHERRL